MSAVLCGPLAKWSAEYSGPYELMPLSVEPSWSRDPRSRALTRGVLMSLARKRDWYFHASYFWTIVWAVLTLGTWPLLLQSYRFDRFRRLEWNQYAAFAQWLRLVTNDSNAAEVEALAERALRTSSTHRFWVRFFVFSALLIATIAFVRSVDLLVLVKTSFIPQSILWTALAYNAVLSVGWIVHLSCVLRQQLLTAIWIGRLNELLETLEKRSLPIHGRVTSTVPFIVSSVGLALFAVVGPTWAAAMLAAVAVQNRYTNGTRAIRLALLERMLEWMDTSGLPVEFDIEEIEPEELVAMG